GGCLNCSASGFAITKPFDFGNAGRESLIESECLDLYARKRALFLPARVDAHAVAVYVYPPTSRAALARKVCGRSMAKETQFAIVVLEEIQIAGPHQHIGIGFRRMLAGNKSGVNINRLLIFLKK